MRRSSIMPATFWNTKYKRGSYNPKICVLITSGISPLGPAQEPLSFWGKAQEKNEEAGQRRWAWWGKRWRRSRRRRTRGRTRRWRRTRRENFARNSFGTQNPHQAQAFNVNIFFLLVIISLCLDGVLGLLGSISSPRTPNVGISALEPLLVSTFTSTVNQQNQFQDSRTSLSLPLALELRPQSRIERILNCRNSSASPHLAAKIMVITMMMVMVMMNLVAHIRWSSLHLVAELRRGGLPLLDFSAAKGWWPSALNFF